jgi:DNA-binding transcriptional ArsR family regulator
MMDELGNFVGEICHIEAAKPGGERFNEEMSDEDRRGFGNLMLMCHRHHVVTDDVEAYSVASLQAMKAKHEEKYSQIEEKMSATITDQALEGELESAKNLGRIFSEAGADLPSWVEEMNAYGAKLRQLPPSTRELLAIVVRRATEKAERDGDRAGINCLTINPGEIHRATGLTQSEFMEQIRILEDHGLLSLDDSDGNGRVLLYIFGSVGGLRIAEEIVHACKDRKIPLEDVYVNLRFDLLDSVDSDSAETN